MRELPDGLLDVIRIAAGDEAATAAASASTSLDDADLHLAAGLLLHNLCFFDGADAYRTLGVRPQDDAAQIKQHYRWLVRWLHPDRDPDNLHGVFADRINRAWNALRTPERRARYDQDLHAAGDVGTAGIRVVDTSALLRAWAEPSPGTLLSARAVQRLPRFVAAGAGAFALATVALGAWMASLEMETAPPGPATHSAPEARPAGGLERASLAGAVATSPVPASTFGPPNGAPPPMTPPIIAAPPRQTAAAGTPRPAAAPEPAARSREPPPRYNRNAAVAAAPPTSAAPPRPSAAIPQPATAPAAAVAVLSSSELREFVERFERLYTADDVERFLALFSPGARGNKGNYADLAGDYRRLFEQRRHRRLSLSDLRWEIDGDRAAGNGRYAAWVGPGVGKPESHTHGQILLQLTRDAHGLRITRLHHTVSP
ncbi:DnaJ domain-containing protein [Tahibacter sp. P2K]|uniref:DnaJ domain-containing protein n=2 Tax=Tahibacter harae TaxID=2963937 RepID=A0ABT1QT65_9GAMM|nr:DnaJ domain-containing protein [Tahibacter harae]MCQ4165469.1 DnaJ domain-containing protein [Tahibacter harae]